MARLLRARDALIAELGVVATATATLMLGASGIVLILWPAGLLSHFLEKPIDVPVYNWIVARFSPNDPFTRFLNEATKLGNLYDSAIITGAAAIFFTVLWRRRQWWLPGTLLVLTLAAEVELQKVLKLVVDRGHPPTALATWPSGGTARIDRHFRRDRLPAIMTWPGISRRWRIAGLVCRRGAGCPRGLHRYVLLQHWITDIAGGWIFGELLLLVMIVSASAIVRPEPVPVTAKRQGPGPEDRTADELLEPRDRRPPHPRTSPRRSHRPSAATVALPAHATKWRIRLVVRVPIQLLPADRAADRHRQVRRVEKVHRAAVCPFAVPARTSRADVRNRSRAASAS